MGHCIQVFIGKQKLIEKLASDQNQTFVSLRQEYAMIYLLDQYDETLEPANVKYEFEEALDYFTSEIHDMMQQYSFYDMLAYIETDYSGGFGTQAGVLFSDGKMVIAPTKEKGIIDEILHQMGVCREAKKDEFDSLGLGNYRRMPYE